MHRAVAHLLLAACLLPAACRACSDVYLQGGHGRRLLAEGYTAPWTYSRNGADWPGVCASGKAQSPIAIQRQNLTTQVPPAGRAQLQFGTAKGLHVINTGKFVQVEWEELTGTNASVPVKGDTWGAVFEDPASLASAPLRQVPVKPLQFHWHSTCEHLVEGAVCPLELHIVTAVDNTTGAWVPERCRRELCLAVFGVTLMMPADPYSPGSPFYQQVVEAVPQKTGKEGATKLSAATLDLSSLLPSDTSYATYAGSLTTPPCSEGVQWHVFLSPKTELSAAQLDAFQAASATAPLEQPATCPAEEVVQGGSLPSGATVELTCKVPSGARTSNRQVMPLNGRTVLVSQASAGGPQVVSAASD